MQQFTSTLKEKLGALYDLQELRTLGEMIIEHLTQMGRTQQLLARHEVLSEEVHSRASAIIDRLALHEPIAYIIGETYFHGLPFRVNEHVLIPRPETSELIELILSEHAQTHTHPLQVLDIGTGSGCIPITLKHKCPAWQVSAIDISEGALQVAHENARRNNTEVSFRQCDILQCEGTGRATWDIIVSNPPYICDAEKADMQPNVLDYEPHTALFVPDNDPLLFYEAIAEYAKKELKKGGMLFFEINRAYGKETLLMIQNKGFNKVTLVQDISKNDRFIVATR